MSEKKLLVVFGATGNQGFSIAHHVLTTPALSSLYTIRAITRNPISPTAQTLQSLGAEITTADLSDPNTLPSALSNAHTIFAITTTSYTSDTRLHETSQARALCTAALAQGAKYLIWSSMSHPFALSGGTITQTTHFDVKAEIETYIRTLPIQSSFYAPASFMQNFQTTQTPRLNEKDGVYEIANNLSPTTRVPLIDITETAAWIAPILSRPDEYAGKFFAAAEGWYTYPEIARIMSEVTGKEVRHVQLPDEVFKAILPAGFRNELFDMFTFFREFGYYGAEGEEQVAWAREQVGQGKVSGLDEFLRRVGFTLGG